MKPMQEYNTTTNSSVYRKLYKEKNASCSYCKWHGPSSENGRWDCYFKNAWKGKKKAKYPNWKLVSKNKKQWMKKTLIFEESNNQYSQWDYWIEIKWPSKIRPK